MIASVVDTGDKVIVGDIDTGDKFIAGDNDTGDKFIAGTTTSVIRVCGVTMNMSFHGGSNKTIGGRVRLLK